MRKRLTADRDLLAQIVRDSSDKLRQFLFGYLLLLTYVCAVVFSTTDRQLLLADEGLKLPLIDITVPLVGFYLIVPYFVLALHFNLLHNATQHHYKLSTWRRTWEGQVPREQVNLLIFDLASLGPSGGFSFWVRGASSLIFFYSGPAAIALVLWRFADYQSRIALWAHVFAFCLDLIFVATALQEISPRSPISAPLRQSDRLLTRVSLVPIHAAPRSNAAIWYVFLLCVILKVLICVDVYGRDWEDSLIRKFAGELVAETDNSDAPNDLLGFLPRIHIDRTVPLFTPNVPRLKELAELLGQSSWQREFEVRGMTLDIRGRSLRYLSMAAQTLPRVWAHNTELQGTNLSASVLTGSNFISTKLQGARLELADLQGSILLDANLRGANLSSARMSGAHLDRTQMQLANLAGVSLAGAVLFDAEMQGANIDGLLLDGAIVNGLEVWAARGVIRKAVVMSPFKGEELQIRATAPRSADLQLWSASLSDVRRQLTNLSHLVAVARLPETGSAAKDDFAKLVKVDDRNAAVALVEAACHMSDAVWLKSAAVGLLVQTMTLLRHPGLELFRKGILAAKECPAGARLAVLPASGR